MHVFLTFKNIFIINKIIKLLTGNFIYIAGMALKFRICEIENNHTQMGQILVKKMTSAYLTECEVFSLYLTL